MIKEKHYIIILSILFFIFSYISIKYYKNNVDNLWDKILYNEENTKIANLTNYESSNYNKQIVKIHSNGVILDGLILTPKKQNNYKAIVLLRGFHKLGKDHPLYKAMAHKFAEKNYFVLLFDFRGFHKSESPMHVSSANDLNFTSDSINAITYLETNFHNIDSIYLIGHSFGAGVAVSAGLQDERVNKIVSIAPGRRTKDIYFGENPTRGLQWIQHRIKSDMHLPEEVPLNMIKPIFVPITIDHFKHHYFYKPVLFIDGELEAEEDKAFLKNYVDSIKAVQKTYKTIKQAKHYFGVVGTKFIMHDEIIQSLVNEIDLWLKT